MSRLQRGFLGFLRGGPGLSALQLDNDPAPADEGQVPGPSAGTGAAHQQVPAPGAGVPRQHRPFPASGVRWPHGRLTGGDADVKVVVTGPFAAGKTTMVTKLGGSGAQVHTETAVSEETAALKAFTTVSLDFASVSVPPPPGQHGAPVRVRLFGTPGQERFDFMWRILACGMHGYVVLVDTSRQFSVDDARLILGRFRQIAPRTPFVVGVSRWTGRGDPDKLARYLGIDPAQLLDWMREVDVREESQGIAILQHLLARVPPTPAPVTD